MFCARESQTLVLVADLKACLILHGVLLKQDIRLLFGIVSDSEIAQLD